MRITYRIVGEQARILVQNEEAILPSFHYVCPFAQRALQCARWGGCHVLDVGAAVSPNTECWCQFDFHFHCHCLSLCRRCQLISRAAVWAVCEWDRCWCLWLVTQLSSYSLVQSKLYYARSRAWKNKAFIVMPWLCLLINGSLVVSLNRASEVI